MAKSKPQTSHQIAAARVAQIEQWLAADESTISNENAVTRAMREFGITHRNEAERLVSRASKQFTYAATGGRPQTHARPIFDMREPVHVSTRNGAGPIAIEQGRIIAATKASLMVQIGDKTIRISAGDDGGAALVDWFNDAP